MADAKTSALTAATTATGDDLLYIVDDPSGTPTSKKITVANLMHVQSVGGNVLMGSVAPSNPTNTGNVSLGPEALSALTSGEYNVVIGDGAGESLDDWEESVLIGFRAGYAFTGAVDVIQNGLNVMVGSFAGTAATGEAIDNVFVGQKAAGSSTVPVSSIAIGAHAALGCDVFSASVVIGKASLDHGSYGSLSSCSDIVAVGNLISTALGTKASSVLIGKSVGRINADCSSSVVIGHGAGEYAATIVDMVAIGRAAGAYSTIALVAIGAYSGGANTTGIRNTYVGYQAGSTNQTGTRNTYIGYGCGYLATASNNTVVGAEAGIALSTGSSNTIIGQGAGIALTTGVYNTLLGKNSGQTLSTQSANTIIGQSAGSVLAANNNTLIGNRCGVAITSGTNNVCVGVEAGDTFTTASSNVHIGPLAGHLSTGGSNIFIGSYAGSSITTDNNCVIGGPSAPATNVWFGKGDVHATPTAYTINGTGGSGTDIAGADIQIAGGKGTGTGAAGKVNLQVAPIGSTGTTLNSLVTVGQFDADATAGNTRFLLWDVDAAALKRVSIGASDSGGSGYKLLRVAN